RRGGGGTARLVGEGDDDYIDGGGQAGDVIDFGSGEGVNPNDFVPPTPTPPPTVQPAPAIPPLAPSFPRGVDDRGRWTELAGSASFAGVSGQFGQSIEPSIPASSTDQYLAWADNRDGGYEIRVSRHSSGAWFSLAGPIQGSTASGISDLRRPSLTLTTGMSPVAILAYTQIHGAQTDIGVAQYDPTANSGAGGFVALGTSM